jgi:hypothetical protein
MRLLLSAMAALLLAGCSSSITEEGGANFVAEIRDNVPGASAYTDDQLRNMADNVCALGNATDAVEVRDNYSQIEAEDRQEVAKIALRTACE